jgi:hypothetical protein
VTVANGGGSYTTTGAASPYLTIPVGNYSFGELLALIAQRLAQYLFNDFGAAGSLPVNVGAVADKALALNKTQSKNPNGTLVDFVLSNASCTIGGNPAPITAVTLKAGWPHLVGLGVEGADVVCAVNGGVATALGAFQSRYIATLLRSEIWGGLIGVTDLYSDLPMSDGDIDVYEINSGHAYGLYTVVNHDFRIAAYPTHVGNLVAVAGDRLSVFVPNPRLTGRAGGVKKTGGRLELITAGSYLGIAGVGAQGWVSRVRQVVTNAEGTNHEIRLWEKWPSTHSVTLNSPLYLVSEIWAARFEAKRLRCLLIYGADDATGEALDLPEAFVLRGNGGGFEEASQRRDITVDRYTIELPVWAKRKSGLTLLTT